MRLLLAAAVALGLAAGSAPAQRATPTPLPRAETYVIPAAELLRVDEGVFEMPIGGTIDLTDRRIFLSIRVPRGYQQCCEIVLNGRQVMFGDVVGQRFDLKRVNSTWKHVEDKEQCFLDVVDVVTPKGAPGIATFRLHCP